MPDLVTTTLWTSTLVDLLAILAALFVGSGPINGRRALLAAVLGGALFAVKAPVLTGLVGGSLFYTVHLAYLFCVVALPLVGLGVLAMARGPRSTGFVKALAALALVPAGVGVWATFVEPFRLVTERATLSLDPERAGDDPLLVAVLADLQSCRVDDHLRAAVRRVVEAEPDLILLPGDLIQCREKHDREAAVAEFRELLAPLSAPLGVWFALGNCDWPPTVVRALEGTEVRLLQDEAVRLTHGDRTVVVGGTDFSRRGFDFARSFADEARDPGEILILVSHYPDTALELPPDSRVDLVVAGHTHGGQVNVPFFGPPITLSRVPRDVAAGGLGSIAGNAVYVSRGVGCERGAAPRMRLNCPPEVSLLTLE